MSLGTKIGVGSIIGTTSSIIIGGYISVLWMYVFSILTSSLIYYEAYLGKKYKDNINNTSGLFYVIKNRLNNKILSYISIIILIILYSFLFQMIQSNTISNILKINYNINNFLITLSFILILIVTIRCSINDIIDIMNEIVPFMCLLFILLSLYAIISNTETLINNIRTIDIFNTKSILTGLIIGIKRSIFMNETLIGTTSISSGIDNNSIENAANIQVLGSYFISFVITTLLTLLLIIYNSNDIANYNELISNVFLYLTGNIGLFILIVSIVLFGITTILSGYYIGLTNIQNIIKCKYNKTIFDIIFTSSILFSIYINNDNIWKYLDILMFIMILINSYSIIKVLGSDKIDR